jgi:protein SCO1/2
VWLLVSSLALAQTTPRAGQWPPRLDRIMVVDPPKEIVDFELTDQNGAPWSSTRLRGQPALIFFGYAHCPDVCPAALSKLKLVHESPDDAVRRAQVVFVSVDGERDTPAALKEYLARLSPDFIGLTGDPDVVRGIAEGFHVAFYKDQPAADASYEVQHSGQIYLIDAAGSLRAELYDPPVGTIETVLRALD